MDKEILIDAKLKTGKSSHKIELVGRSPLRGRGCAMVCRHLKREEEEEEQEEQEQEGEGGGEEEEEEEQQQQQGGGGEGEEDFLS